MTRPVSTSPRTTRERERGSLGAHSNIKASLKASSWKKFFLDIKSLDYSDKMLPEITASANPDLPPGNIFETISKTQGLVYSA
jgi:hypothetical protein